LHPKTREALRSLCGAETWEERRLPKEGANGIPVTVGSAVVRLSVETRLDVLLVPLDRPLQPDLERDLRPEPKLPLRPAHVEPTAGLPVGLRRVPEDLS